MTTLGTLTAGAWAGEQLLAVAGTVVISGKDLKEGQNWMIGVGLLATDEVVLLGWT